MKLMIRNTSRDKTTAAMRKARPGDVQPNPTIKKVRLPPGGSLTVDSNDLSSLDARLIQKLMGCGCLRTFAMTSSGPMRAIDADEIGELCDLQDLPAPPPEPVLVIPEPAPVAAVEEVEEDLEEDPEEEPVNGPHLREGLLSTSQTWYSEEEAAPVEEPVEEPEEDSCTIPYLEDELRARKNVQLRSILSDGGYGRTTGMNKSALISAILEMQES